MDDHIEEQFIVLNLLLELRNVLGKNLWLLKLHQLQLVEDWHVHWLKSILLQYRFILLNWGYDIARLRLLQKSDLLRHFGLLLLLEYELRKVGEVLLVDQYVGWVNNFRINVEIGLLWDVPIFLIHVWKRWAFTYVCDIDVAVRLGLFELPIVDGLASLSSMLHVSPLSTLWGLIHFI